MEQARNSIKSMMEGSPLRLLIRFALPLMLGNILQQLYVVVDTAIVGLAPAVGCTEMEHPNHHHWVEVARELRTDGGRAVAVFVASLEDAPVDEHDRAFRDAIATQVVEL